MIHVVAYDRRAAERDAIRSSLWKKIERLPEEDMDSGRRRILQSFCPHWKSVTIRISCTMNSLRGRRSRSCGLCGNGARTLCSC